MNEMSRTEKLNAINRVSESGNTSLGVMFDCAVDNAGFDGLGGTLHTLPNDAISEIYRHLEAIIDANMIDCSDADLALARKVFYG